MFIIKTKKAEFHFDNGLKSITPIEKMDNHSVSFLMETYHQFELTQTRPESAFLIMLEDSGYEVDWDVDYSQCNNKEEFEFWEGNVIAANMVISMRRGYKVFFVGLEIDEEYLTNPEKLEELKSHANKFYGCKVRFRQDEEKKRVTIEVV
ncbi:MAG: hypothetical protein ACOC2U_01710 [bacterium]